MTLDRQLRERFRVLLAVRLGLALDDRTDDVVDRCVLEACGARGLSPAALIEEADAADDAHPVFEALVAAFTEGETHFYRDAQQWEALHSWLLLAPPAPLWRAWSAGCSTGEEAWTLGALLADTLPHARVNVLGTDVNRAALAAAAEGRYGDRAFRGAPEWLRGRHFERAAPEVWSARPALREALTFAPLNLRGPGWPSVLTQTQGLNVILCRNVLIYLGVAAARETVGRLLDALAPGGLLVVGLGDLALRVFDDARLLHAGPGMFVRSSAGTGTGTGTETGIGSGPGDRNRTRRRDVTPLPALAGGATFALAEARRRADRGDLATARQWALRAAERDPDSALPRHLLGLICAELGETAAAVDALRKAVRLDRDCAPALFALGDLLVGQGQRVEGAAILRRAATLLAALPEGTVLAGAEGMTAGALLTLARLRLEQSSAAAMEEIA